METTVTGLFSDANAARRARLELEREGVPATAIEVISERTANLHALLGEETADAVRGAAVGAGVAGIAAAIAGAALALPPIGLFASPWWLVAAIGGGCGVAVGGLLGWLIGSATGHQVQEEYEHGIRRGGAVLAINTDQAHSGWAIEHLRVHGASALSTSVHRRHRLHATA